MSVTQDPKSFFRKHRRVLIGKDPRAVIGKDPRALMGKEPDDATRDRRSTRRTSPTE